MNLEEEERQRGTWYVFSDMDTYVIEYDDLGFRGYRDWQRITQC